MSAVRMYGSLEDADVQAELSKAQQAPRDWTVYLVPVRGAKRTLAQNKLYRALLSKLAQQLGQSVKYWNDFLVEKFLGFDEVETEDGDLRRVLCSTSELGVAEFTSFLNACLSFASDHQVH
ncbi:recombination protein NinB [Paraburkholderia sp. EG287A]|uniref:recombination protein NinB n=1 Tax=Paraburkholderia sp. EG287A TaxID=3237012 RepID=UPI0034D27ED6